MILFGDFFCLKDGRDNFDIRENEDWELVLGFKKGKEHIDMVFTKALLEKKAPHLVYWGSFGCGKTHHLNYAKGKVKAENLPFKVIMFQLPDVVGNSPFNKLFEKMVNEVGMHKFRPMLNAQVMQDPAWVDSISPMDVQQAFKQLALNESVANAAWTYLSGIKLDNIQKGQVGVTKNQLNESEEFASVLSIITTVIRNQTEDNQTLLYLIDEAEGLADVNKPDSAKIWRNSLRKLMDNDSLGMLFTIAAESLQNIPAIMSSPEIVRRIAQDNFVPLEAFTLGETQNFLKELLNEFIDSEKLSVLEESEGFTDNPDYDRKTYPFTKSAFEGYCNYLVAENRLAKPSEFLKRIGNTTTSAQIANIRLIDRAWLESLGQYD
jgi:hypothetical protein